MNISNQIKNYNRELYFSEKNDNKNIEERFIHSLEESIQKKYNQNIRLK